MNYEQTQQREAIIRQKMDVLAVWECDMRRQMKEDKFACGKCDKCQRADRCRLSMGEFFNDLPPWGPIDPRVSM